MAAGAQFPGFSREALTFLRGLARNNRRDWFQPRKDVFESKLKAPLIALIEAVNEELLDFAPDYITDPKKALYRIYRDTRFSADKTPYKTHIAAMFRRRGLDRNTAAGFYFHLAPKNLTIAAGSYMPGPDELRLVRPWLAENFESFRKAAKPCEKLLGKLQGVTVTRMPKGFDTRHPAADLIRMKQWYFHAELDPAVATTPKVFAEIVKRFRVVAPVVQMLNAPFTKAAKADSFV